MCGIYGAQFKSDNVPVWQRTALLAALGLGNAKRGTHSWGALTPAGVQKGLGSIVGQTAAWRKFAWVMAHTRFATVGDKTVENSHPFVIGHVTGAHNGAVYNHNKLDEKYGRKFAVDSQHIFAHLNENLPLSELTGYGTAEWVDDREPGRIYLVRLTDNGELAAARTELGVVWSSDKDHLEDALDVAQVKERVFYTIEAGKKYYAENGTLYWLKDSDVSIGKQGGIGSFGRSYRNSWWKSDYDPWEDDHEHAVSTLPSGDSKPLKFDDDYSKMDDATLRELAAYGDNDAEDELLIRAELMRGDEAWV